MYGVQHQHVIASEFVSQIQETHLSLTNRATHCAICKGMADPQNTHHHICVTTPNSV